MSLSDRETEGSVGLTACSLDDPVGVTVYPRMPREYLVAGKSSLSPG